MELLLYWLGLRWLAQMLRAGDARTAGEDLDRKLDGIVGWLKGLLQAGCGCYVAAVIGGTVIYVVTDIIRMLKGGH